jgi:hypothetical protein
VCEIKQVQKKVLFCLKNIDFLERAERDFFITDNHITFLKRKRKRKQEILNQPGAVFPPNNTKENIKPDKYVIKDYSNLTHLSRIIK